MERTLYGPPAATLAVLLDDPEDHDFQNAAALLGPISDETAHRRLLPEMRTIAEIAAHLIHNNEFNLTLIQREEPLYTFPEAWSDVSAIPWPLIRDRLLTTIASLKDLAAAADLDSIVFPAEGDEPAWTIGYKLAASVAKHQAYHMGQIALLAQGAPSP